MLSCCHYWPVDSAALWPVCPRESRYGKKEGGTGHERSICKTSIHKGWMTFPMSEVAGLMIAEAGSVSHCAWGDSNFHVSPWIWAVEVSLMTCLPLLNCGHLRGEDTPRRFLVSGLWTLCSGGTAMPCTPSASTSVPPIQRILCPMRVWSEICWPVGAGHQALSWSRAQMHKCKALGIGH